MPLLREARRPVPSVTPRRAAHVAERLVDGEMVLYDAVRRRVHVLNATAAFVWRACDGEHNQDDIVAAVRAHYPRRTDLGCDVAEVLAHFRHEGLLSS